MWCRRLEMISSGSTSSNAILQTSFLPLASTFLRTLAVGGFRFLGELSFHGNIEGTAVAFYIRFPVRLRSKSLSLECREHTRVFFVMLKYLPTSLRIARIHSSLELLSLGNLWKDIFIPSSRYVFLVHSGTRQFWTISKLTCSYVYVFFEVDWSGRYDLVSVQTLPGLSARRPSLNKVYANIGLNNTHSVIIHT